MASTDESKTKFIYNNGFNNTFQTEALPNSLPLHQNNPLYTPHNLYAEQISGTVFTTPRHLNKRTWMCRCLPSCASTNKCEKCKDYFGNDESYYDPNPIRWFPQTSYETSFIHSIKKYVTSDTNPSTKNGLSIYLYAFQNTSQDECMINSDGDFLIVPQKGTLIIQTELGMLEVSPCEIIVIPRGIVFSTSCDSKANGYILEIYKGHFELPELGPIGANGLANARDFLYPTAHFSQDKTHTMHNKYANALCNKQSHAPFNVVSWHGNYSPYKYNLNHFNTMSSVSYDHPDPSIYIVLTAKSNEDGTAIR